MPNKELINIIDKYKNNYKAGKIVLGTIWSGDIWDNEVDRLKWLNKKYGVLCEEMETVSVYTICNKLNVPVIGIRIISNNEILQEKFDPSIIIELQKFVIQICEEIINIL